jgi:predicted short-subunit dehydrogenase-like oxidoreductase (DUF2520 family)
MTIKSRKDLIIGSGRLARHFREYYRLLEQPCLSWSRNSSESLEELAAQCTHAFILISDSAIEEFIEDNACLSDLTLVHCSGALFTTRAIGLHPLMTFADELYSLEDYQRIPFVIDRHELSLKILAPFFKNPYFPLSPDKKSLYHSLCVASGNFTSILWKHVFEQFEDQLGLPREILNPYLDQIVKNLKLDHKSAVTGPIQRKDLNTINKNIEALPSPEMQQIYRDFARLEGLSL